MAIQIVYQPPIHVNYKLLSKRMINIYLSGLSVTIKWIIDLYPNGISTAIPNGLLMAMQIDYQPQSKWIINYFPSESSTSIQMDYQPQSSG